MFNRKSKSKTALLLVVIMLSILFLPVLNAYAITSQDLYDEMHLPHEGIPHGVPNDYSWHLDPDYYDLVFPTTVYPPVSSLPHTWDHIVPWGAVYEAEEGNPAMNTRVQIKDIQGFYLSYAENQWHKLAYELAPVGGFYPEDFVGDAPQGEIRTESDGSISVIPGGGRTFHFFTSFRTAVNNPDDIKAIYSTFQSKLALDDPNGTDDRSSARFVADAGIDLWYDGGVGFDNFLTNTGLALSRFRYVTSNYQNFSAYSARAGVDITTVPAPPVIISNQTPPPTPPPGAYFEDFNDNLAQNWTLPTGISVSGNILHTDDWGIDPFATYDGEIFEAPYTYKINVKTGAGGYGNRTKIVFNAADSNNYYALDLGGGESPPIYLNKVIGGVESTIATSMEHTRINIGTYTTFEITYISGGYITAKATQNGTTTTLFDNVFDGSRTSGKIGVSVRASVTQFDNVLVFEPIPAPTPPIPEIFQNNVVVGSSGTGTAEISNPSSGYTLDPDFATHFSSYFNQQFSSQPQPLAVVTPSSVTAGNKSVSQHGFAKATLCRHRFDF